MIADWQWSINKQHIGNNNAPSQMLSETALVNNIWKKAMLPKRDTIFIDDNVYLPKNSHLTALGKLHKWP